MPIDPADQRKTFERLSNVREVVFGMQDGVLTTAGMLCGLSGAVSDHKVNPLPAMDCGENCRNLIAEDSGQRSRAAGDRGDMDSHLA